MDALIPLFKVLMSPDVNQITEVLYSGYIGQGKQVNLFEKELKEKFKRKLLLTVNSGTSALDLSYHLLLKAGDEVISTPQTCTATNSPLIHRGIKIRWADIDPFTGLIKDIPITNKTKAIISVDWAGKLANYPYLKSFGLPVIQDAAHSFSLGGDYTIFSLQAIKHITAGDGGVLFLPEEEQYHRAKLLRWFGLDRESNEDFRCQQTIKEVGYKYHMNDINAFIGRKNLVYFDWVMRRHKENAHWFCDNLKTRNIILPEKDDASAWWFYQLIIPGKRDIFKKFMTECNIGVSQVHARNDKHPQFYHTQILQGVDYFDANQLAIPCGWWLTQDNLEYIAEKILYFDRNW